MIDMSVLLSGLQLLANWHILLVVIGGMLLGLVIGIIPGTTAALGLAVILPLTFNLDALTALMLMTSVYTGSLTGGGILAILINMPGTPGAVATTFDGYPLTRKGQHNEALGLQISSSVIGGFVSYFLLLLFIQPLTRLATQFGPSEMFTLTVFVILIVGVLQGKYISRSIYSGILGLILSTVGTSLTTGAARGTFGFTELEDGLPLILCVIGMFALPELFDLVTRRTIVDSSLKRPCNLRRMLLGISTSWKLRKTWLSGSAIGVLIGLLPAAGATLASLLSYSVAKRFDPRSHLFGTGEPAGVVAAESANNASEGGAMAILLSLGIPGSASTAVMLGAFMLHGLVPGNELFTENGTLVYAIIIGNLLQMVLLGVCALAIAWWVARIVVAPSNLLVPILIVVLTIGAFTFRNLMFDVFILYLFGIIGWLFKRYHFPLISLMLGLFLGRQLDEEVVRLTILFGDNPLAILERPITVVLIAAIVLISTKQICSLLGYPLAIRKKSTSNKSSST